MIPDTFVAAALDLDADERAWVSQSPDVAFRPLILNVSQGYYINILRVRASGVLSRHRHSAPVHALRLRGAWHYLEHDWAASAGDYAFEPAGATHTLVMQLLKQLVGAAFNLVVEEFAVFAHGPDCCARERNGLLVRRRT
jgi:2,4'-dihydroxyacetophenone dioxygenase